MRIFFVPIVVAVVFTGLLSPVYHFFYRIFWKKSYLASFLSCFFLILVVLIPSFFILQSVITQMKDFFASAVPWFRDFSERWEEYPAVERFMNSKIGTWLIEEVDWPSFINTITRNVASIATSVANKTYTGVLRTGCGSGYYDIYPVYFLIDGKGILQRNKVSAASERKISRYGIHTLLPYVKGNYKGNNNNRSGRRFFSAITLLIFGSSMGILGIFCFVLLCVMWWLGLGYFFQ
jgi:predicted PurR-regulated permease PerM